MSSFNLLLRGFGPGATSSTLLLRGMAFDSGGGGGEEPPPVQTLTPQRGYTVALPGVGRGDPYFMDFSDVLVLDEQTLAWDFGKWLPEGTTLVSDATVNLFVVEGDPSVDLGAQWDGDAIIGKADTTVGGSGKDKCAILRRFTPKAGGMIYAMLPSARCSDGDKATGENHITVVNPS